MLRSWLLHICLLLTTSHALAGAAMFSQNVCNSYPGLIKSYGFTNDWLFPEASGTSSVDAINGNTANFISSPTLNLSGPLVMPSKSIQLNGINQYVTTSTSLNNPTIYTLLVWFKTSVAGGKLIGFGNLQSGASTNYDRHIYMSSAGQVIFGAYSGSSQTVMSPLAGYNDNKWHMAVATMGATGMALYVDGSLAGTNVNTVSENHAGYWRIGYDTVSAWPGSSPTEYYQGQLGEVAVANGTALTGPQIQNLYSIGTACSGSYTYTAPSKLLTFSPASQAIYTNNCSASVTLASNYMAGVGGLTANLSSNSGTLQFYSDAYCTASISAVTIPNGSFSGTFYFSDSTAGTPTITAAAATYTSAVQSQTLTTNPYIWLGGGANANWSTAGNWSGGTAPGSGNIAVFNTDCVTNCSPTISASITVAGVKMMSGYSGTITQAAGQTITVGAKGWIQNAGTFVGGNSAIAINANFILTGGAYTSTSGIATYKGSYSDSGVASYSNNGGSVVISGYYQQGNSLSFGTRGFQNLSISGSASTYTVSGSPVVAGTLTLQNVDYGCYMAGGTINVQGNVTIPTTPSDSNTGCNGTTWIKLTGSGNQSVAGNTFIGRIPALEIASTGGTVTMSSGLSITAGFLHTSGSLVTTGTTIKIKAPYSTSANVVFNSTPFENLYLIGSASALLMSGTANVSGQLHVQNNDYGTTVNGGTINASGDIYSDGAATTADVGANGSALIRVVGSGPQTIYGPSGVYYGLLPKLEIASSGTVTFSNKIRLTNSFTNTSSGGITTTGSSISFFANGVSAGFTSTIGSMAFNNLEVYAAYTAVLNFSGSTLTANGNLTITEWSGCTINNATFEVYGNMNTTGNSGGCFGNAAFSFLGGVNTTVAQASSVAAVNLPTGAVIVNKPAATLTLAGKFNPNSVGQTVTLTSGAINMAGFALSTKGLTLNGNTITMGSGTLTVNGSVVSAGAGYGGTVAP